ncbi:TAXI family TRAP transporter solute-binding subunit [Natrarchaeobaculum aegyptiacum]|uniref:TAXI family TRAP transporter solute-binding subunit n=1 Tax=Natrarchaeobaculum aegyptiacum TaxID=745377 RepID=UPI000A3D675B|nr:TAXI family TRAP transporter solute-binding subunit [Natrarchaeobaculum aegyptiacum]
MNRRSYLAGIGGTGLALVAGCVGGENRADQSITVAGGDQGSGVHGAATAIEGVASEELADVTLTVQQTSGTQENQVLLSQGQADVGLTTAFDYELAQNEEGYYADNPLENNPSQGFDVILAHIYMLAREGTGIETYDDLIDQNVWAYQSGSSFRIVVESALEEIGLWDEISVTDMPPDDVAGGLEEGRIDAVAAAGASYQSLVGWSSEVDARVDMQLVDWDDDVADGIDAAIPGRHELVEPYGWENQNFDMSEVVSIPVHNHVYFTEAVSNDVAYDLTMLAHENAEQLLDSFPGLLDLSEADLLTGGILPEYPIHPGVADAYEELGVWDDDWTTA